MVARDLMAVAGPAVAVLALAVAAMVLAPPGPGAYFAPLLLALVLGAGTMALGAMRARAGAVALLVGVVVAGLCLNFRVRELGDTSLDWQNGAKMLVWGLIFAIGLLHLPATWRWVVPVPGGFILAYCLIALASAGWSEVPFYTFGSAFGLLAYLLFAGTFALTHGVPAMLRVMTWALGLYVAVNLVALAVLPDMAWMAPWGEETRWRAQGLSGHPNVLGQQMGLMLMLAFLCARDRLIRLAWLIPMALGALGLLLASGSRGALVACIASVGLVLLRRRPLLLLGLAGLVSLALGLLVVVPADFLVDFLAQFSRSGDKRELLTLTGRTELWSYVLDKVAEKPLLGWGFNGVEPLFTREFPADDARATVNAHNMYLQTLVSVGIIGSLPILGLILWSLGRFVARPVPERDVFFFAMLINGMSEVEIFGSTPSVFAFVFFAILMGTSRQWGKGAKPWA